jgi:urease accessory protein
LLAPALHILTEPDHLVACFAIGLLAGQRSARREAMLLLAAFVITFAVAFCVAALTRLATFESLDAYASAVSLIAAGALVAVPRIAFPGVTMVAVLATGTVHGFANGLAASSPIAVASAGAAVALIAVAGWALAALLKAPWGVIAVRVLGSWAAALGLILLGIALR